jgi:hypothetical protein
VLGALTLVTAGILVAESMNAVGPDSPQTHSMFSAICSTNACAYTHHMPASLGPKQVQVVCRGPKCNVGQTWTGKDWTQERDDAQAVRLIFSSLAWQTEGALISYSSSLH